MDDAFDYTGGTLDRLVDGMVYVGISPGDPKDWMEVDGSWADIRARIERTGQIDQEVFLEVLDLENAISNMKGDHPAAALTVIAKMFGFSDGELRRVIRNPERLTEKGKAYLSAYLSGEDPEEAFRRRRRSSRGAA